MTEVPHFEPEAPVWVRFLPGVGKVMKDWLGESRFRNILPPSSRHRVNQVNNQQAELNGCFLSLLFGTKDGGSMFI